MRIVTIGTCRNALGPKGQMTSPRHGQTCPVIHVLAAVETWTPGTATGMTWVDRRMSSPPFPREQGLTILPQPTVSKHIDHALLDGEVESARRRLDAEHHHQRSGGAPMGHRDGVD